jgi:hypothetical protein
MDYRDRTLSLGRGAVCMARIEQSELLLSLHIVVEKVVVVKLGAVQNGASSPELAIELSCYR